MSLRRWCAGGRLAVGAQALLALAACSSPSAESPYPPITGTYGGQASMGAPFNPPVEFSITYRSLAGTETSEAVQGTFIVSTQNGSRWSGRVDRHSFRSGTATGRCPRTARSSSPWLNPSGGAASPPTR